MVDKSIVTLESDVTEQRRQRLRNFLSREDAMQQICDNVASGGSVPAIAKILNVSSCNITRWIRADAERSKQYDVALRDRDEWEHEQILHQLRSIANFDIRSLFNDDGQIRPISEWPDDASVAIGGIEVADLFEGFGKDREQVGHTKKIKLIDRLKALELSGKRMTMFKESTVHSGYVTLEQLVFGEDSEEEFSGESH